MNTGLKDRVVIVAASSQGIGRATAEAFAAEGVKLAICSRNNDSINSAAQAIRRQHNVEVFPRALDVTDSTAVQNFVEAVVNEFGSVDVCVTNAGGPPAKRFLELSLDEWNKAVSLNLLSTVYFCRAVLPHMRRNKWGRIVTITSVSVKQPIADLVLSNTVRTGVVGLVKSLANEFGRDGITVNNVAPGYTATERLKELAEVRSKALNVSPEEMFQRWAVDTAVGRISEPSEVADAIVWLASERASTITGQTLLIDGGSYRGTM
jgi:3-oxoacyl-[acyl-carrier protein] reductase